VRDQWRETAAARSLSKKEEVVNLEACDEAERWEPFAFGRQLVTDHVRIEVWLRLFGNGVGVFVVRVARDPAAWPVLVWHVGELRGDKELEDGSSTVRSEHGVK